MNMMHEARSPAAKGTHTEASPAPEANNQDLHVPPDLSESALIPRSQVSYSCCPSISPDPTLSNTKTAAMFCAGLQRKADL